MRNQLPVILVHFLYTTTTHIGMDDSGSGDPQSGKATAVTK